MNVVKVVGKVLAGFWHDGPHSIKRKINFYVFTASLTPAEVSKNILSL